MQHLRDRPQVVILTDLLKDLSPLAATLTRNGGGWFRLWLTGNLTGMLQSANEIRPSIVHWRLRMSRRILTLLAIMLALYVPAFAQEHPEHAAPAKAKSATLMTGYGNWHHPVSTKNAQAQAFFDQGLRQIYAFNHDEAARSFQRAAELDAKLAMAYWCIA